MEQERINLFYLSIIPVLLLSRFLCVFGNEFNDGIYALLSPDQHEHTPRLEDFFWTGSGDGPPPPSEAPAIPVQPSKPIVKTTTVLATVYLDSYPPQAVTDKTTGACVTNCGDPDPGIPGSLEPDIPDDRRYWLLTVIQGSTPDSLQLKLARLYQKAFLRQQERHLGIIKSLDAPSARKKHDVHSFAVNKDNNFIDNSKDNVPDKINIHSSMILDPLAKVSKHKFSDDTDTLFDKEELDETTLEIRVTKLKDIETWVLVTPTAILKKREVTGDVRTKNDELIDIPLEPDLGNETLMFKREIIKPEQQPPVQVHIQNITESPETGSVQIVYVVLVGGRAVPAAVAARDMRLVRDAEVARELGAVVTTKAEPAYLKAAEGLAGEATTSGVVQGAELWALVVGSAIALILMILLLLLLCRLVRRKKAMSAASLRAYRNELIREVERNQLKQVHEEKDGKLISVVSPSRTRPSSTLLPVYRASSASSSSASSGVSEMAAAFNRRRQKKPHALRMPQKKRVGTTDSLLEAAGIDSSDSAKELSAPATPTSYLSMPSVRSFPRGNVVEPLSRVLEPILVRHLDIDSQSDTPKEKVKFEDTMQKSEDTIQRRQMSSQLVRLGSIDKDPGVIGPLVWDLHCQRIKDVPKPPSPQSTTSSTRRDPGVSRMRQRFNELMDDAFSLFGSPASSPKAGESKTFGKKDPEVTQARNDNVRLPGSPYTALDTVRGRSAGVRPGTSRPETDLRPRTSLTRPVQLERRPAPSRAWDSSTHPARLPQTPVVNPALILAEGRLAPEDPALPLISAIKSEIQRVRENAVASRSQERPGN